VQKPCKEIDPDMKNSGFCNRRRTVLRTGEIRIKEENPSIEKISFCPCSSSASFHNIVKGSLLADPNFKSINLIMMPNFLFTNTFRELTELTLGH
jgi:hypothetical protein